MAMDSFLEGYLRTALWSSTDSDGNPLDQDHDISDIDGAWLAQAEKDCRAFETQAAPLLEKARGEGGESDRSTYGHDFWLTRNGHGAGFWDGDYGRQGEALSKIAHTFGEIEVSLAD